MSTPPKKIKNCWEYMNCPTKIREKCRAFTRNPDQKCWLAIEDPTVGGKTNKDYTGCKRCPWYKKNKPKETYWFSHRQEKHK
jgi:hypothetical protein